MIGCRWELLRPVEPWAAPQASLLGFPVMSGIEKRENYGDNVDQVALYAACAPIAVPAAGEGERSFILRLEVFGALPWFATLGSPSHPPQPTDGNTHALDPTPGLYLPPGGMAGLSRSIEIRAVRPGSLFILQPTRQ